jgi:hypothetical protein
MIMVSCVPTRYHHDRGAGGFLGETRPRPQGLAENDAAWAFEGCCIGKLSLSEPEHGSAPAHV